MISCGDIAALNRRRPLLLLPPLLLLLLLILILFSHHLPHTPLSDQRLTSQLLDNQHLTAADSKIPSKSKSCSSKWVVSSSARSSKLLGTSHLKTFCLLVAGQNLV